MRLGFSTTCDGGVACDPGTGRIVHQAVLLLLLVGGSAIQLAPSVARAVEFRWRLLDDQFRPIGLEPRGLGHVIRDAVQHCPCVAHGPLLGIGIAERSLDLGQQVQRTHVLLYVEQVKHAAAQVQAGLGQPHRVQVRPDEVFVRQVQARGSH